MNEYLVLAIKSLHPEAEFSFTDNDYSTVKFDVIDGDEPTLEEVNAEIARLKQADLDKAAQTAEAKAALLERLGITEAEAKLLLA
jgi:hypothetical protein